VSGQLQQLGEDAFVLPDGTEVTFFRDDAGVPRYLASRRGVGIRP
jgi:hypothetical protein